MNRSASPSEGLMKSRRLSNLTDSSHGLSSTPSSASRLGCHLADGQGDLRLRPRQESDASSCWRSPARSATPVPGPCHPGGLLLPLRRYQDGAPKELGWLSELPGSPASPAVSESHRSASPSPSEDLSCLSFATAETADLTATLRTWPNERRHNEQKEIIADVETTIASVAGIPITGTKFTFCPQTRRWTTTTATVEFESRLLNEGAMRLVFPLTERLVNGALRQCVGKIMKHSEDETAYFRDLEMHAKSAFLAQEFNRFGLPRKVAYTELSVVQCPDHPHPGGAGPLTFLMEPKLEGQFVKYNNNAGFVSYRSKRTTPQAFSHFTYHYTRGQLLVCDIQGVGDTFTDPEILSNAEDGGLYGKGDIGRDGMVRFFLTHQCGPLCKHLQLPTLDGALLPDPEWQPLHMVPPSNVEFVLSAPDSLRLRAASPTPSVAATRRSRQNSAHEDAACAPGEVRSSWHRPSASTTSLMSLRKENDGLKEIKKELCWLTDDDAEKQPVKELRWLAELPQSPAAPLPEQHISFETADLSDAGSSWGGDDWCDDAFSAQIESVIASVAAAPLAGTKFTFSHRARRWRTAPTTVVFGPELLNEGAMRLVFPLTERLADGSVRQCVGKIMKHSGDETSYFRDMEMHAKSAFLAREFNRFGLPRKVAYTELSVVQCPDHPHPGGTGPLTFLMEPKLEGQFVKYNNNAGFVSYRSNRSTPQAFSHFTYHYTHGQLLVCDIQGVKDKYTDPQILSNTAEGSLYGKGDIGRDGIERFFMTHQCGPLCKHLKLPALGEDPLPDPEWQPLRMVPPSNVEFVLSAPDSLRLRAASPTPVIRRRSRQNAMNEEGVDIAPSTADALTHLSASPCQG